MNLLSGFLREAKPVEEKPRKSLESVIRSFFLMPEEEDIFLRECQYYPELEDAFKNKVNSLVSERLDLTVERRSNLIVMVHGPPNSGKSEVAISLAKNLQARFKNNGIDSRLYITFNFDETHKVLKKARQGDIIVQDETVRQFGVDSDVVKESLNNILRVVRDSQICFFFLSPEPINYVVMNLSLRMAGIRTHEHRSRCIVYVQTIFPTRTMIPIGYVTIKIHDDEKFREKYLERKRRNIRSLLSSGGKSSVSWSQEELQEDAEKVLDYVRRADLPVKNMGEIITLMKTSGLVQGSVSYEKAVARYVALLIRKEEKEEKGEKEGKEVAGPPQITYTGDVFDVIEVTNMIIDRAERPLVDLKRLQKSWLIIREAYKIWHANPTMSNRKIADEVSKRTSEKTDYQSIRYWKGKSGIFHKLNQVMYTYLGYAYETWTKDHYWAKLPNVVKTENYGGNKNHPDIVLYLNTGETWAVSCKCLASNVFNVQEGCRPELETLRGNYKELPKATRVFLDVWDKEAERPYRGEIFEHSGKVNFRSWGEKPDFNREPPKIKCETCDKETVVGNLKVLNTPAGIMFKLDCGCLKQRHEIDNLGYDISEMLNVILERFYNQQKQFT